MEERSIMEQLRDKLNALISSGVSQADLEKSTGVKQSSISRFARGETGISGESFVRLLPLVQGKVTFEDSSGHPTIQRIGKYAPVEIVEGDDLPLIPVRSCAGAGLASEFFSSTPEKMLPVLPQYFLPDVVAIKVTGDSMEPTIQKGAYVGVVPIDGDLVEGAIYLVYKPPFGYLVKRVQASVDGIILVSDNQKYPPQALPFDGYEKVVIGKVVWVWQTF